MSHPKGSHVSRVDLQDYLQALAENSQGAQGSALRLLSSYAELQYRLSGGSKCPLCRAHVRHAIAVRSERPDGSVLEYSCLCTRCLEAERYLSERVTLTVGQLTLEYLRNGGPKASSDSKPPQTGK